MKINVFEGARRIALLLGAMWTVAWVSYGVLTDTGPAIRLAISPSGNPTRVEGCGIEDALRYAEAKLANGDRVSAEFCFTAHRSSDGRMLIPYAVRAVTVELPGPVVKEVPATLTRGQLLSWLQKDGYDTSKLTGMRSKPQDEPFSELKDSEKWLMADAYAGEVRRYMDATIERLVLPADIARQAVKAKWDARWSRLGWSALFLFGGLVAGWVAVAATGWVVRGFLGIPRGLDYRPKIAPPSAS